MKTSRPKADMVGRLSAPNCDSLCEAASQYQQHFYTAIRYTASLVYSDSYSLTSPRLNKEKQTYGDLPGHLGEKIAPSIPP